MAYQKTQWVNNLTPVNSENLNKIEQGVYQNSIDIENIDVTTQVNYGIVAHNTSETSHDDLRKGKIDKAQIKNTLSETVVGNVLDATQGKVLNDKITMKSDKTYVDNQDSVINNKVGDTTTLTTTDKTSTVAAINELDSEISILSTDLTSRGIIGNASAWATGEIIKKHRKSGKYVCLNNTDAPFVNSNEWSQLIVDEINATNSIVTFINKNYGVVTCVEADGIWSPWSPKTATTDKIDTLSLPFVSGVTDLTQYGIRTRYTKDSMGFVSVYCECKFSNASPIPNTDGKHLATMPIGFRPKYFTSCAGNVIYNDDPSLASTVTCTVYITDNGEIRVAGLTQAGTNNTLRFSLSYFVG